jgi:hypothetical protein
MDQLQAFHRLSSQIQILYNQSVITFLFPILAAPAVSLLLWEISNPSRLVIWAAIVVLFSLARYLIIWKQRREPITPENANKWLDIFTASVFISGILWGCSTIFLVPYEQERLIEFTIYNSLVMLIVCGLVAGAVVGYAVSKRVILFYAFPALIPPGVYLIILGDSYNTTLGGFVLLYFIFITASSFRLNRQYSYYLGIEYQMIQLSQRYKILQKQLNELSAREKGRRAETV